MTSVLVAIPARNEASNLPSVAMRLERVRRQSSLLFDILVVDDGSVDRTASIARARDWTVLRHASHLGYGASLVTAFQYAIAQGYSHVITLDADGQHPPELIPEFIAEGSKADVISGSRYLEESPRVTEAPWPEFNYFLTGVVNSVFGLRITDVGCGMKCISRRVLVDAHFEEMGYLFPLEFWGLMVTSGATLREIAVPLFYPDPSRNLIAKFGSAETAVHQALLALVRSLRKSQPSTLPGWAALRVGSQAQFLAEELGDSRGALLVRRAVEMTRSGDSRLLTSR